MLEEDSGLGQFRTYEKIFQIVVHSISTLKKKCLAEYYQEKNSSKYNYILHQTRSESP